MLSVNWGLGCQSPLCIAGALGQVPSHSLTWGAVRQAGPSLLHGWPYSRPVADTAFLFLVKKPHRSIMILECEG